MINSKEHIKYNKMAQVSLQSQELAKRVFKDNKQNILAKVITRMSDIHYYEFKDNCLYRFPIYDTNNHNAIYCLNNFEFIPLLVPSDTFGDEIESGLTTPNLSDLYVRFMDITYSDFRQKYLDFKRQKEIDNLDKGLTKSVIEGIIKEEMTFKIPKI